MKFSNIQSSLKLESESNKKSKNPIPSSINIEHKILNRKGRGSPQRGSHHKQSRQKARDKKFMNLRVQSGISFELDQYEDVIDLVENATLFMADLLRCSNKTEMMIAVMRVTKHMTKEAFFSRTTYGFVQEYATTLFNEICEIQSDNPFSDMRDFVDSFSQVKRAPVFRHAYKVFLCVFASSLFEGSKVPFVSKQYHNLEKEMMQTIYDSGSSWVETVLSSILFLCERGYQCMIDGNLDPLYHSENAYDKWIEKAHSLKKDQLKLAIPIAHNFDRFAYLADLREAIELGQSIKEKARRMGHFEFKVMRALVSDLEIILSQEITKRAAMRTRTPPFGVLVFGDSSVAKSTFSRILFYHYGKVFGLNTDDEFQYTRNPKDPFWSGFNSTQWSVVLDDVADMAPGVAQSGGDPSMMEVIQVMNYIPVCPNQADLADKGKTPLLARQVIATSNTQHMNTHSYFSCPLAVKRRLPCHSLESETYLCETYYYAGSYPFA